MNAPKIRDDLFSELHSEVLKPRGYKKSGHWSTKKSGDFVFAVYLRASRWSNSNQTDFWFDLKVFHEGWHHLFTGEKTLPKLRESMPSIVLEELGELEGPQYRTMTIDKAVDLPALKATIIRRLHEHAVPIEVQCITFEGILRHLEASRHWPKTANSAAGISLLLDQEDQAKRFVAIAKANATHENTLRWLEQQELRLWSNWKRHS